MKNKYDINEFVKVTTEQTVIQGVVERVKSKRKQLKITQKQLSMRSGVTYPSIRRFETTGEISFTSLLKIAKVLNCLEDFNFLFDNEVVTNLKDY